jgi:chromate transporter
LSSPTFAEASRYWLLLGFISFGGPAGQIAIMHREVVERRGWVDEKSFTGALNFCMLLPGPEALQLAIYLGWRLHGVRGGLVAGLGFILPAIVLLTALSYVYARHGSQPVVAGLLLGLKAAVVALVVQAIFRIARRALRGPLHWALAILAFVGLELGAVPFPAIILAAGIAGAVFARGSAAAAATPDGRSAGAGAAWVAKVGALGLALWVAPLLAVGSSLGFGSLWARIYLFFTQAALITFGGAYAVLGYVTDHLVTDLRWLTAEQSVAGLALAETTPGPLVIVLQFMGFMTGWNQPGALSSTGSALLASLLASWATFLPSFVLIFIGAPYIERLSRMPRVSSALAAITAAVVGIIATLALLLARVVFFPHGLGHGPAWAAVAIAAASWWLLERTRLGLPWVLALAATVGLLANLAG